MPVYNGPRTAPEKLIELGALARPSGLDSELLPNSRALALGAKATVYIWTCEDGRGYALVDENGDHKVDRVSAVTGELDGRHGVTYQNTALYIVEISRSLRRVDNPPKLVADTADCRDEQHGWRYVRFAPDGWLYIPIGAPCHVCKPEEPIFSFRA